MKTLGMLLSCLIFVMSVCLAANILAQQQPAPVDVNQLSSATEVIEFLNKSSLARARIGLDFDGGESHRGDDNMSRMNAMLARLSEWAYFSSGFTVESFDGCRLRLKNDQVKILKWYSGSADQRFMSLSKFLMEGRKGEKQLTPQSAVLSVPIHELKYKKEIAPKYLKYPPTQQLLGAWQIEFNEKNFFRRSVVHMDVTAAEGPDLTSKMTAQKLLFTFEDKQEAENFNVAFRRAIQLCSKKK